MSAIEQSNFAIYRDDTPIPSWQPYKAKAYSEVSTDSAVGAASMEDPFASQGESFTIYEDAQGDEEEEEME